MRTFQYGQFNYDNHSANESRGSLQDGLKNTDSQDPHDSFSSTLHSRLAEITHAALRAKNITAGDYTSSTPVFEDPHDPFSPSVLTRASEASQPPVVAKNQHPRVQLPSPVPAQPKNPHNPFPTSLRTCIAELAAFAENSYPGLSKLRRRDSDCHDFNKRGIIKTKGDK